MSVSTEKTAAVKSTTTAILTVALLLGMFAAAPIEAQQHRATRLGNPATRFAPPRRTPEDLRALFADPKLRPDIESILGQCDWPGDPWDLYRAAQTAEIVEVRFATGTVWPYMSSREDGKPVALREVLWAGRDPVEAYVFTFVSKGRRYQCVTPKPCSNFYVEDLGAAPAAPVAPVAAAAPPPPPPVPVAPAAPGIEVTKQAPAEASLCDPIELKAVVRNIGNVPLTQVRVTDPLAPGVKMTDDRPALDLDLGTLESGEGKEIAYRVVASARGSFGSKVQAISAQGARGEAAASTQVRSPSLELACSAPATVSIGRSAEVCLTIRNTGDAPEPLARVRLAVPAGATVANLTEGGTASTEAVVWDIPDLAPGASRKVCAMFNASALGAWALTADALGVCAAARQAQCAVRVMGVGGILLEVVDVDDPVEVGHPVEYLVTVKNQGSVALTNIRLACYPHANQEFVTGTGQTPIVERGGVFVTEPVATLEAKEEAVWRIVVKAVKAGDSRFKVELTADQYASPVEEYESTEQY